MRSDFCADFYEPHPAFCLLVGCVSSARRVQRESTRTSFTAFSSFPPTKMSSPGGEGVFARGKTFRGKGVDDSWKKIQERTFSNWVNDRLRGNLKVAKKQLKTLEEDLKDGQLLIELLNRLVATEEVQNLQGNKAEGHRGPKSIEKWDKNPRGKLQSIENIGMALQFCRQQNIKLVNIGPEDIYGGNLKLILGLLWTLVSKYQIKSSGKGMSTKKAMLGWVNTVIPEYDIANFSTDWNDGRAVCGMADRIQPGLCPNHFALERSRGLENCRLGMDLSEQHLDIPKVLTPEDLNNPEVDDLSVMTYLSYFCQPYNAVLMQWIRQKIPHRGIKNLSTDWNNGINLGALTEACFPGICSDWESMDPSNAIKNNEKMIGLIKERLGIDCPVSAAELADPKMDEIVVATYLHHFRNAKLRSSPEQFSLLMPPLPGGCAIVQETFTFEVQITHTTGEDLTKEISVQAHGPKSAAAVSLKPNPEAGGSLLASFVPMEAGSYDIIASYNGENIQGSPFQLQVADPAKCQFLGGPPGTLQVGVVEEVVVKTRGAGDGKLGCSVDETGTTESDVVSCSLEDNGEDTYTIRLEPKQLGKAKLLVTWAGRDIEQSPITLNVSNASQCSISGLGDEEEYIVGKPVQFTVNTAGAGEGNLLVKPRGASALYTPNIESSDNEHSVSFTPWEVGEHSVEVLWEGAHVPGSPLSLDIRAAPDANACSATGSGLKRGIAGRPNTFKVLSPEKGLLQKKNGLEVTVSSADETVPVEVTDNEDTTYTVTYTPPSEGAHVASITFYEKPITGSPFQINVVPAADASKCKAYGPALHPNSLHIAGTPLDLFVDTKKAGTGDLQVVVKGPNNTKPKVYQAEENGVHSLKFDVPDAGKYYIHVWWSEAAIPRSPFKVRVHPGPVAANVVAHGPGLEPTVKVGDKGEFTVETKNAGIGTLTVRVHGVKGKFKIEANPVDESNPRTLLGHYDPQEGGDYIIAIRWSGVHVPNSPFHVHILDKEREKKKKKQISAEEADGEEPAARGKPRMMTNEEMLAYQQQQMLLASGRSMAYVAAGGAVAMQKKYKPNPSMTPAAFAPEPTSKTSDKKKAEPTSKTSDKKVEKKKPRKF